MGLLNVALQFEDYLQPLFKAIMEILDHLDPDEAEAKMSGVIGDVGLKSAKFAGDGPVTLADADEIETQGTKMSQQDLFMLREHYFGREYAVMAEEQGLSSDGIELSEEEKVALDEFATMVTDKARKRWADEGLSAEEIETKAEAHWSWFRDGMTRVGQEMYLHAEVQSDQQKKDLTAFAEQQKSAGLPDLGRSAKYAAAL